MAEFKLGRIRFVWKGVWSATTQYYVDDVVKHGGQIYICSVGHVAASSFDTDLEAGTPRWNLMSSGQDWKGSWTTSTSYKLNDLVKYGGSVYICIDSHTSAATDALGLEDNYPANWSIFAEGFDWKSDWAVSTRYKLNDLVKYGGYTYVCTTGHTSAATTTLGLETNSAYWDTFNEGIVYKGNWAASTRYKRNDVVKYGAGLWICSADSHTSTSTFNDTVFTQFVEGFEFESTWSSSTTYQPGDVVSYGGYQYVAKTVHSNVTPTNATSGSTNWDLYSKGFSFQNDWVNSTSYKVGEVVRLNGYTYLAIQDSPTETYTITATTAGDQSFTVADTTNLVAGKSIRFTGTTFGNVFTGATYYVKTIVSASKFTVSTTPGGTTFSPTTASGSMTGTVAAFPTNATYWTRLNSGIRWQGAWTDDTEYVLGDAVSHSGNTYICVLGHRSEADDGSTIGAAGGGAANSRPDQDTSGTYWNALTLGSEVNVLTTAGDMIYYSGSGPARLPIGTAGQVLQVSTEGYPEWAHLWGTAHVYYVAPHGTDAPYPVNGGTLQNPWASIRYACQQVENGALNPNAKHLLEMNRSFIQKEVTEWIQRQIAINSSPFSGGFDYDEHKCERDIGFVIDRIIWDITHGGNLKTRAAAQTYVNALSEGPYSTEEFGTGQYTKLSTEGTKDIAAFNYMETVINSVLANTAPATNYQVLNADNSTAIVEQYINTDYTVEAGVTTTIAGLVDIITNTLAAGDSSAIPERIVPANTIYVKTGTYYETLPIIVPAETAIIGDEVRSVHVRPSSGTIPRADSYYTVQSLDRLATVVSNVATGTALTATTGNTTTQTTDWPVASSAMSTALSSKVRAMKYNVDFRVGTINSFSYPDPTDYNTYYLVGYGDARTLVLANKEFFKAQIEAWITANYPNIYYSRTSCKRDVGYIVDALVYDLTYGGNAMSVQAGLAYYQGVGSSLYIDSTEKTATLAAYAYLKSMVQAAAVNTTITSLQSTETQVKNLALTGGSAAVTFLGNCLDEMIDIVNNGPSAETLTDPSTSWVASAYTTDYSAMNGAVSTIQTGTIDYINSNFGSFTYNSALCRRDAGYLVDAAYYDAAFGSNFWAVQNGLSYLRTQAAVVSAAQLEQEIGAIGYIKTQVAAALAGDSTAVSRSNAAYEEIIQIIQTGTITSYNLTSTGVVNHGYAAAQLMANRNFIVSEMVTWMTANVPGYVALSAEGKTLCQRDLGYAIDALAYDVNYDCNIATRNFCRSLFNNITGVGIESVNSGTTYTRLGVVCSQIVTESYAGQDTSGTAASSTEATLMTTLCGNISTVATAGSLSGLVAESLPSVAWAVSAGRSTLSALASAKTTIVAGTLQYITDTYSDFSYNHSKCSRDVATIIKAVGYDMMFNANFQSLKAGYSYLRATATEVFDLNQKSVSRAALTYVRDQLLAVTSNATAEARITALFLAIDDIIYSGSNEGNVCQSEDRMVDYAITQLERNRDFIVQEIHSWMNYNYVNFDDYYTSTTCARDIGYIIDAVVSDLATGSNVASSVAGESYYRIQAALVPGAQMMQTVAAVKEAKRLTAGYVTHSSQYTAVNAAFDNVIAILSGGLTAVPTYTWPDNGTSTVTTVSDAAALQTNRTTMVNSIHSWLLAHGTYGAMYSGLTTAQQNKCKRDVGYMIDAVSYDLQYGGNMQSTIAGSAYYSFGTLEIASGEKAATVATLTQLATLMKAYTSAGGDTTVDTLTTLIAGIINSGATEPMTYTKPSVASEGANTIATHAAILAGVSTIKTSVTTYITNTFSSYTYDTALCNRDTNEIIDALIWDLKYSSNYRTLYCSQYYANAAIGSLEENMFLLRNGTGLRNMTLEGLDGDLTPENDYGTRRTTAGAYASLDPGWGPDDFRTWILSRSPYVQNVCTFGYAAIGQKIDGSLHNGGYKSMVSNDFTQLISDGIGAWVTNNGRAELVSVFTYYSHVGYLSENGGKIRGTNGNNSYGDFGSVAEGYDVTETPNTAVVDNKAFKASVGEVFTDSTDNIYIFEFDNAGSDYSEVVWTVSGAGLGAVVEQDEFRDDAVFQVRLLDNVDDSTAAPEADGNFGGFGYLSNANTAQTGTSTSITIAATDSEISSAYVGMKIYLTGSTGVGQYGIISSYNSGTKVANVVKESTGVAGWDHVVPGTTIVSPDASTTYIIEPRISFTSPSFTSAVSSLPTSGTWTAVKYGDTSATYSALAGTYAGAGTGARWNVQRNGSKYFVTSAAAGTGYTRLETITIAGTSLGGLTTSNDLTITITAVNSVTGAIQAWETSGYGLGGRYVAVRSGTAVGATSEDGITWTTRTSLMPTSANWTALAHGMFDDNSTNEKVSRFVAVATGSTAAGYSADGITWTTASLPVSANWVDVTFGESKFVAVASNSTTVAISNDGEFWDTTGTLPSTGFTGVAYGMGLFVAVKSGTTSAAYSTDGVTWTSASLPAGSAWNSVTWGNGKFVAVATNSNSGAISLDGVNWTAVTMGSLDGSSVAGYQKIAYGQGLFMATSYISGAGDYTYVATSEDGLNWTARGIAGVTNASAGYSAITFGNPQRTGRWVALGKDVGTQAVYIRGGATAKGRAFISQEKLYAVRILEPGSGYDTAPTMTITDPNNTFEAPFTVRIGKGALGNPSFKDRGTGFSSASAEVDTGDGYGDYFQDGSYIAVKRLTQRPVAGSNVVFGHLPNQTFKLVNVLTFLGSYDGSYTAFFQVSPPMKKIDAPAQNQSVTTRIRYSQVRLTGHDFLNIGFGNFEDSNYPNEPLAGYALTQPNETVENNGGRVFFTSTDQDGNFKVGDLFTIEQSTGVATLNADAFNIAGLQELTLGEVTLGGGSATITEFSTDPYFTANSDNVIPTQRAIKAYISSQIGGGGASLNVNSVTAGSIYIATNYITTVGSSYININAKTNFTGGVTGTPLALNYFIL